MDTNNILAKLTRISQQPFLIFANQIEEKTDNAFETLQLLRTKENVTAGSISEFLDIKPSSVTQIIKKLESAGMAERVKSEADARVAFVKLTDKGKMSLEDRGKISINLKEELFKDFNEEELENLDEYLEKLLDTISSDVFQENLNEIFADDKRWKQFSQMSAHFSRAREQMLENSRFGELGGPRRFGGFEESFHGGIDRERHFFKRGHKK